MSGGKTGLWLLIPILTAACVLALVVSTVVQFRTTDTVEAQLTAEEARGLAGKLDAIIQTRAAAVGMAAGSLEIENLATRGGLERLLNNLKELFPDFLSLEVLNDQGQTLAMMGDLSLSQAARKDKLDGAAETIAAGQPNSVRFQDDPAEHCFYLTLRHTGSDKVTWYSRTTFSRQPIDLATLSSDKESQVGLQSLPPGRASESDAKEGAGSVIVKKGWWTRPFSAEVPLSVPGWTVTLQRNARHVGFSPLSLILPCLMLLVAAAAGWVARRTDLADPCLIGQLARETPPTPDPIPRNQSVPAEEQASEPSAAQPEREDRPAHPDAAEDDRQREPDQPGDELFVAEVPRSAGFDDDAELDTLDGDSDQACDAPALEAIAADPELPPPQPPFQLPAEMAIPDILDFEWTEAIAEEALVVASEVPEAEFPLDGPPSAVATLPETLEVAWTEAAPEENPEDKPRDTSRVHHASQVGV